MRNLITAWGILRLVYGHLAWLHAGKSHFCYVYVMWESKGGVVMRAFAYHQCGSGSNPHVDAICGWDCWWFSPLLPVLRFFSLLKKQHFQSPFIALFIYVPTQWSLLKNQPLKEKQKEKENKKKATWRNIRHCPNRSYINKRITETYEVITLLSWAIGNARNLIKITQLSITIFKFL